MRSRADVTTLVMNHHRHFRIRCYAYEQDTFGTGFDARHMNDASTLIYNEMQCGTENVSIR